MKRSTERILTTHVGSLPRPPALVEAFRKGPGGELEARLRTSIRDVVAEQSKAGIDVVSDGEFSKPVIGEVDYGAWMNYVAGRMAGFEMRPLHGEMFPGKDRADFRQFYQDAASGWGETQRPFEVVCSGQVAYRGQAEIAADIARFKAGLEGAEAAEAFMCVVSPTSLESLQPNLHYERQEDYAWALAEAMREEYRAVADAGLVLQIDDPGIWVVWDFWYAQDRTMADFRKFAELRVEMLNHALEGVAPEQVRYHACWGSWHGPHSTDVPLKDIADLLLKLNVGAYCLEAANVRHEHDWKVWREVDLNGRIIIPGAVSHSTNLLEHPEVVADRLIQYAKVAGRENVIAGTDCGLGGRVHPQLAWAKLKALADGAALASRELWG